MAGRLQGKVALITGASSGIGEATALALAAEGARVALAARRADRLTDVARRITDNGGEALTLETDVTDFAQAQRMVKQTADKWGRLDILVNNAGVMLLGSVVGADITDWQRMIQINLLGLMYATHEALPLMQAQGGGEIVNISSVAGRVARLGNGVYAATKFGVVAFSESLRQEVTKQHIRVTVIEPGAVDTELSSHITQEQARKTTEEWIRSIAPLHSEDIAAAITFVVTQPPHVSINELLVRPTEQDR